MPYTQPVYPANYQPNLYQNYPNYQYQNQPQIQMPRRNNDIIYVVKKNSTNQQ